MSKVIEISRRAKSWLYDRVPAPMAAPETQGLRRARYRILYAMAALGLICIAWTSLPQAIQPEGLAIVAGLVVFLALQIPVWAIAKSRADDAWLFRNRDDA